VPHWLGLTNKDPTHPSSTSRLYLNEVEALRFVCLNMSIELWLKMGLGPKLLGYQMTGSLKR